MRRSVPFGLGFFSAILLVVILRLLTALGGNGFDFSNLETDIRAGKISSGDRFFEVATLAKPQDAVGWRADDGTRFGIWQYAHGERELWLYVRIADGEEDQIIFAAQILDRSQNRRTYQPSSVEWLFADPVAMKELAQLLANTTSR